jgi:CPA1 family monovalent cation:H+ antiporter
VAKQIVATVFCAYAVYFAADYLQFSGIFAVVACGIALRHFERRWITLTIADEVLRFWDVAAIAANALVFFLVGAALQIGHVAREPAFVVACLVAIAVSRVVLAATLLPKTYPREWIGVVRVAGMRGALSLALAVALPASTPYREAIVDATFAVALATILASALAADRVVRSVARSAEPSS